MPEGKSRPSQNLGLIGSGPSKRIEAIRVDVVRDAVEGEQAVLMQRLWRLQTIQSADEKRARRRFNSLLRAFDTEDLAAILKAVETSGREIKQCAPGPPMDINEEMPGCSKDTAAHETEEDEEYDEALQPQKFEDSGLIPQIDKPMSMPYLCCKLWRWKDLQVDAALHRLDPLPWCRFGRVTMNNATVSCCNPYHYALWIIVAAESGADSEEESLVGGVNGTLPLGENSFLTNDTGFGDELTATSNMLPPSRAPPPVPDSAPLTPPNINTHHASSSTVYSWALMYRWEEKKRMDDKGVALRGAFVAVGLLADAVHDGQNVCSEWDLKKEVSFALIRQPDSKQISEDVWIYNSGSKPLFISMSSSSVSSQKSETIRRVSSGYCYRVHRFIASRTIANNAFYNHPLTTTNITSTDPKAHIITDNINTITQPQQDPANTHCFLNISVGKGWGSNYRRINHTDTPCRYEVIFVPDFI
ncbi:unnamed protein product [Anisakis simplex]|uniref:Mothers against decapentaplegic homolog n=1 Tax=Anisakis simplex TaxID=6269 RepID=A0A0M3K734_ANISI|nr:unnamed protein product [Anisakis simplex]